MQAQEPKTLTSILGCVSMQALRFYFTTFYFIFTLFHFINAGSQIMKACLYREYILFQRNAFVFKFKAVQVRIWQFHPRMRVLLE